MPKPKPRYCEYRQCPGFRRLPGRFGIKIGGKWRAMCVCCAAGISGRHPDAPQKAISLPGDLMVNPPAVVYTDVLAGLTVRELFGRFHRAALMRYPFTFSYSELVEIGEILEY